MSLRVITSIFLALLWIPHADACTAFVVYRNGLALAGNNEDFWLTDTKIWFVPNEGSERGLPGPYGRVYFGYSNFFPQGGMNEAGLFFDGFATAPNPIQNSKGRKRFDGNLTDHAMAHCETVEEVVALFREYDLSFLTNAMLMFADPTGDSVIIEGDEMLRIKGDHQIVTNFYQSKLQSQDGSLESCPCPRYAAARETLAKGEPVSVEICRDILARTAQRGTASTQYSNVYDLEERAIYLYHFYSFDDDVRLDLEQELQKGAHEIDLPSLFPEKKSFTEFQEANAAKIRREIESRLTKDIDRKTYVDFAGLYAVDVGEAKPREIRILVENGSLFLAAEEEKGERRELLPEGKDRFFFIGDWGPETFAFERDKTGTVCRVLIQIVNTEYRGERLEG